MASTLHIKQ